MRKSARRVLVRGAVAVAVVAAWLVWEARSAEAPRPPGTGLSDLLSVLPESATAEVFTHRRQEYLAVSGPYRMLPRLPSGPPVYVYDRAGRLADWTADSGDDEAFQARWFGAIDRRAISLDELRRWPGAGP